MAPLIRWLVTGPCLKTCFNNTPIKRKKKTTVERYHKPVISLLGIKSSSILKTMAIPAITQAAIRGNLLSVAVATPETSRKRSKIERRNLLTDSATKGERKKNKRMSSRSAENPRSPHQNSAKRFRRLLNAAMIPSEKAT